MKLESPAELWVGVEGWEKGGRDLLGEAGTRPGPAGRGAAGGGRRGGGGRGGAGRGGA